MRVTSDSDGASRAATVGPREKCSHGHAMTEENTYMRYRRRGRKGNYWERECRKCKAIAARDLARRHRISENRQKRPCRLCGNPCLGRPRHGTPDGLCGQCRAKTHTTKEDAQ